MARVKRGVASKKRHKKVLKQAKGYYGNKSRSFRAANEQVMRSGNYAFRDRRARKGEMRRLWIQRINAGTRLHDMSYSRFIAGMNAAGVEVDRKILADLAVTDIDAFGTLVATAKDALAKKSCVTLRQRSQIGLMVVCFSRSMKGSGSSSSISPSARRNFVVLCKPIGAWR
jgi:large subunit ribosomal protein L20